MTATAVQPKPAVSPPRPTFTLQHVSRGKRVLPLRTLLYGLEGIGKSTFGASMPNPVFLCAESGTDNLDVARLENEHGRPLATLDELLHALKLLASERHDFGSLVLDTVDWIEPMIWAHICARDGKENIEDYGYGKGYQAAIDEWRKVLALLEPLRSKGMQVLLLAHSALKTFKNPEGPDFDRYTLKVHDKAGGLLKEWCDLVLFSNYEGFAVKREKEKAGLFAKGKGVSTGARLIHTERTAAYDAKNRHGLPPTMPLGSWAELEAAIKSGQPAAPAVLEAAIREALPSLSVDDQTKVSAAIGRAAGDAVKLSQLHNLVLGRLAVAGKEA